MKLEKNIHHNYNNKKVIEWIAANHVPTTEQETYGCYDNGWGCSCVTEPDYETDNKEEFVEIDGKKVLYQAYYDKYYAKDLTIHIPNLTEEEKEDLIETGNLRVYYCSHCHEWALDGDEI